MVESGLPEEAIMGSAEGSVSVYPALTCVPQLEISRNRAKWQSVNRIVVTEAKKDDLSKGIAQNIIERVRLGIIRKQV